jgi:hypothetical protein
MHTRFNKIWHMTIACTMTTRRANWFIYFTPHTSTSRTLSHSSSHFDQTRLTLRDFYYCSLAALLCAMCDAFQIAHTTIYIFCVCICVKKREKRIPITFRSQLIITYNYMTPKWNEWRRSNFSIIRIKREYE